MLPESEERTIHPREREIIAMTYFLAIFPLFGILVAGAVLMAYQHRSETVVFHAKQAIAAHVALLAALVVVFLACLLAALVGVLSPMLKTVMLFIDRGILFLVFTAYVGLCCYFAWKSLEGRDLDLPFVGPHLRKRPE